MDQMLNEMIDGLDIQLDTKQIDKSVADAVDTVEERLRDEFESEINRIEDIAQLAGNSGGGGGGGGGEGSAVELHEMNTKLCEFIKHTTEVNTRTVL